jgi:hypothetical protein
MQRHVQDHLKALELQWTRERQRDRDQVEEELHKMRQQLTTLAREQQQHQKQTLVLCRDALDELRKEIAEALHRVTEDIDHLSQQMATQAERQLNIVRHEMHTLLRERDQATVTTTLLGELLITLGKQLQQSKRESDT